VPENRRVASVARILLYRREPMNNLSVSLPRYCALTVVLPLAFFLAAGCGSDPEVTPVDTGSGGAGAGTGAGGQGTGAASTGGSGAADGGAAGAGGVYDPPNPDGLGPAPVELGATTDLATAGSYVLLAKTGITNVTGSSVSGGHLGVSPAAASFITGFSLILDPTNVFSTSPSVVAPWQIYASDYAVPTPANLTAAVLSMQTAYTDAAGRTTPEPRQRRHRRPDPRPRALHVGDRRHHSDRCHHFGRRQRRLDLSDQR
jgi:hypothetical protein